MERSQLLELIKQQLDSNKIQEINVLDITKSSNLASYIIIGTGTSNKNINAVANKLCKTLKELNINILTVTGENTGWFVIDLGDIIIHLFTQETREIYKLSDFWTKRVERPQKLHFVGINGSGIAGIACMAKTLGFEVDGCDLNEYGSYSDQLNRLNIEIKIGHNENHITPDTNLVVVTPALLYKDRYKSIPELEKASQAKKMIRWQEFLGNYLMKDKESVAVAGTHGKTTVTTFLSLILEKAGLEPNCIIGGTVKEWNQTYRVGKKNLWYIVEADEYAGNFLYYHPKYILLNNVEMEHPEYFKDFEEYRDNFKKFLLSVQNHGSIIFNYDDKNSLDIIDEIYDSLLKKDVKITGITFNNETNSDLYRLVHIENTEANNFILDKQIFKLNKLFGEHNIKNMSMATALAKQLNIQNSYIQSVLDGFSGAKRRMELIYNKNHVCVYDDYGHHHTQIYYTIKALKDKYPNDKILVVFEPHLVSRFQQNYTEYINNLRLADFAIITRVFKSREIDKPDLDINSYLHNQNSIKYIDTNPELIRTIKDYIHLNSQDKIHILVLGAGLSYELSRQIARSL